jgi:hypothetical protein
MSARTGQPDATTGGATRLAPAFAPVGAARQSVLASLAMLALLLAGVGLLYVEQFAQTNAYIGIGGLPLHRIEYWWLMAVWLLVLALVLPSRPQVPSDLFLVFYVVFCCLWSAAYWPATRYLEAGGAAAMAALLVGPAVTVHAARAWFASPAAARGRHAASGPWRRPGLIPALMVLLGVAAVLAYRVAGDAGGFAIDEATARRLEGRESFSGAALPAYLLQMSANGLAPFLAYLGTLRRVRSAVVAALAFAVLCFWLLGLKSPVAAVLLLAGLGWLVRRGAIARATMLVVGLFGFALVASIVEMLLFDVSAVAEFFVRRVTLVSSVIQAYFVDALSHHDVVSLLTAGFPLAGHATPEYYIGATYMGSDLTNANTNAFLHEWAAHGFFGYLAATALTCAVLVWCDRAWLREGRADGFAFALMLAVLLVEQAITTALVSSGLLACMLLSALFSRSPVRGRAGVPAREQTGRAAHRATPT